MASDVEAQVLVLEKDCVCPICHGTGRAPATIVLPDMDWRQLRWLAVQSKLMWGGLYDQGGREAFEDIARWEDAGLIEAVEKPQRSGRMKFGGGYRATPLLRSLARLPASKGGE